MNSEIRDFTLGRIDFGKYKGESLEDVYRYDPSYLEWCILNVSNFCFDYSYYEERFLPTPMPYKHIDLEGTRFWVNNLMPSINKIREAKLYLKEGYKLEENSFKFSEEAKSLCNWKMSKYEKQH